MNIVKKDPVCLQGQKDCKRYNKGFCTILTDTKFNKPCPFYKKKEDGKK